jgi:hypothetical protein
MHKFSPSYLPRYLSRPPARTHARRANSPRNSNSGPLSRPTSANANLPQASPLGTSPPGFQPASPTYGGGLLPGLSAPLQYSSSAGLPSPLLLPSGSGRLSRIGDEFRESGGGSWLPFAGDEARGPRSSGNGQISSTSQVCVRLRVCACVCVRACCCASRLHPDPDPPLFPRI